VQKNNLSSIYIDASPILHHKLSGIGHLCLMMIEGLLAESKKTKAFRVKLLVPARKISYIAYWGLDSVEIVKIPLLARIWNNLPRLPYMPGIDYFFGKGLYIYPNFKYWPVSKQSRSITYVHDISFLLYPEFTEPRNLNLLASHIERWVYKSDIVITDSYSSRDEIIDKFPSQEDKIEVVYCGVDSAVYKKFNHSRVDEVKVKYGIAKKYLMFLSSIEPRKNIDTLLQALRLLPDNYKERYGLLLVGGMGWNNEKIINEINKLKKEGWDIIVPKAYVSDKDVAILLSGAELLVHPAIHEGFGIPPIEAMSSGVPAVVSDIPVLHEVCSDAAVYVKPLDPQDIANKLQQVLIDKNLRTSLIQKGILRAKKFTWTNTTTQLVAIANKQFKRIS